MKTATLKKDKGITEDLKSIMSEIYKVSSIVRAAGIIAKENSAGEEHLEDIGNLAETATDTLDRIHKLLFEAWEKNGGNEEIEKKLKGLSFNN